MAGGLADFLFHEEAGVRLYCGDAREVLELLYDDLPICADLGFADPPYNSDIKYGSGTDDDRTDYWPWLTERVERLKRVSTTTIVKHSALRLHEFHQHIGRSRVLVWSKPFSSGFPLNGVSTHWEPLHMLQGKSVRWSKDVFECVSGNRTDDDATGHPAQFPALVATWLISTFCDPRALVIDAFSGSGTMLQAAKNLNRRAIGIEIEPRYCEIAVKRLRQEVLPLAQPSPPTC